MKKILSLLILFSLTLSLASCSIIDNFLNPSENSPSSGDPSGVTSDDSTLNGVSLTEFAIVYSADSPDYTLRAAKYIHSEIVARTGLNLYLTTDDSTAITHEIVVGETNRTISGKLEHKSKSAEFSILADNGSVALEADYFVIAAPIGFPPPVLLSPY